MTATRGHYHYHATVAGFFRTENRDQDLQLKRVSRLMLVSEPVRVAS